MGFHSGQVLAAPVRQMQTPASVKNRAGVLVRREIKPERTAAVNAEIFLVQTIGPQLGRCA